VPDPDDASSSSTARVEMVSARPRHRTLYIVIAVIVGAVALSAVLVAAGSNPSSISGRVDVTNLPDEGPAPALVAKGWINSPPLTQASLTGKVVLYDIWTYSCINCVRTFPYVRAWYERYKADGLVVIGVHSPEFDFEKVHSNVEGAVKRLDVTWPVALDDDMTIWNELANQYWPADYVADRAGHLRYHHFGEGDYVNTENVLRSLLNVPAASPRANQNVTPETASGQPVNPETYLDVQHGMIGAQPGLKVYPVAGRLVPPAVALQGPWTGANEKVTSAAAGSQIAIGARAQSVNMVLASATGKPMDAIVTLDGAPVPVNRRGASVHVDANGRTVVSVTAPDMYRLVLAPGVENHQLLIVAEQPGLEAYSFTFG
jgi:thiol-disulfide isomerase/thioredoxin